MRPLGHEQPGDLTGAAVLVDSQELPDTERQGETFATGSIQQASVELALIEGQHGARGETQPADGHGQRLGVKQGEVGEPKLHPRVLKRHLLAAGALNPTAPDEPARSEWLVRASRRLGGVLNDVQERLQAGLHTGIGGVGVDLEDEVRLGAHL